MNKTMQQPNGPGPTMAEQAKFVNGKGTRLIGAADPSNTEEVLRHAVENRLLKQYNHFNLQHASNYRLGYTIGTSHRKARK